MAKTKAQDQEPLESEQQDASRGGDADSAAGSDMYYVNISNARDLRRAILEASKLIIENLQSQERLKKKREQKMELIEKMRGIFEKINDDDTKFLFDLPDVRTENLEQSANIEVRKQAEAEEQEEYSSDDPERQELRRLQKAISDIEKQLNQIE